MRLSEIENNKKMHVAMYPWFAYGHMTPFLHLANNLAKKGNKVSFFLPTKAILKLASHNYYPHLITFIPITIPPVDGLPVGAETTADFPYTSQAPLLTAMDLTQSVIESYLMPQTGTATTSPINVVFFDYAFWLPGLARKHGIKSIYYVTSYASDFAYKNPRARGSPPGEATPLTEADLSHAPPGFPSSSPGFRLHAHEARGLEMLGYPSRSYFHRRLCKSVDQSDAICFISFKEMEREFGDYISTLYKKPVLWAGVVAKPYDGMLETDLEGWLKGFDPRSVVYCALGSESVLEKDQFQELALGLELTSLPFLAVLKLPKGCEKMESALPKGFIERTKKRGSICSDWVQQQLILKHPSVGCFVTHCGAGSLTEALVTHCQLVLLPHRGDQFINARLMGAHLKVGVEIVKREEDGFFTKEDVCKAILTVMELESEGVGKVVRANHEKWKDFLLKDELEDSYINDLVGNLQDLMGYD